MEALKIRQKIIDNFQHLNSSQLSEILDFTEFLIYKSRQEEDKGLPNQETIDTMKKTDAGDELTEYDDINDFYREMGI